METKTPNSFVFDDWPGLMLQISPDYTSATLTGNAPPDADNAHVRSLLSKLIRASSLQHGLQDQAVRQAVERLSQGQELDQFVIARGTMPVPGQDAKIELLTEPPSVADNNSMTQGRDFRDRSNLQIVEAGTIIARLIPETPAQPGKNILGETIIGPAPRMLKLQAGAGVELKENETIAVAAITGLLARPLEDKFEIIDQLEINGDVDYSVGHIDFPGLVKVKGSILSGFKVIAYALDVDALESNSQVEVQSDLKVRKGIMDAKVKAGGNVTAFYISQGDVEADGDVLVSAEIVQSTVRARGKVILTTDSGRIVNSQITGVSGVQAGKLVNSGQEGCRIRIGMDKEFEQQLSALRNQITKTTADKKAVLSALADDEPEMFAMEAELKELISKLSDDPEDKTRENLMAQINMIKPLRAELKAQVQELNARLEDLDYSLNRLEYELKDMLALAPTGVVRVTVKEDASSGTIILTPRASLVLEHHESNFSATEAEVKDKVSGTVSFEVKLSKARLIK